MFTAIVLVRLLISHWLQRGAAQVAADRHALARLSRGHRRSRSCGRATPGLIVSAVHQPRLPRARLLSRPQDGRRVRRRHRHRGARIRRPWITRRCAASSAGSASARCRSRNSARPTTCCCASSIRTAPAPSSRRPSPRRATASRRRCRAPRSGVWRWSAPPSAASCCATACGRWAWAAAAMFIYITFRFEWPFAVGAIVTMFLDLTKTVGFFAADRVRVQPDVDRGDPHHHGLLDQRQDRRLRPRAREPDALQEDAAGRADRSQHQRDADAHHRHLGGALPGDRCRWRCSAGRRCASSPSSCCSASCWRPAPPSSSPRRSCSIWARSG